MILQGEMVIPAPRQRVWDAIWDIPSMVTWVPGCTGAEQVDERTYRVRLEQQVSVIKASFDLLLTVTESEPPSRLGFQAAGEDRRVSSKVQVQSIITLSPAGTDGGATRLAYRHDLSVFGRLGAIGFPLIQRKAKEAEAEFARRATAALARVNA